MNLLDVKFSKLKKKNEGALIAYFPLGEVGFNTIELARTYIDNGVDILEIGFPVETPYLDGKVVSDSMKRILNNDFEVQGFFDEIKKIRREFKDQPLEVFAYTSVFEQISMEDFLSLCENSGVDSVLFVGADNLKMKELSTVIPPSIYNLWFVPYNYSEDYINEVKDSAKGYIFLQATDGVTGARNELESGLKDIIRETKKKLDNIPICPGFGISNADHCKQIKEMGADGVIIGSSLLKFLVTHSLEETGSFIKELKSALK
ncbi:tryptophan synthase subunit alpha [Ruminiclostridium papyrosolvens DSM 2782]|uniref:tryptophan synthase subunit alpha n=1 Tax=Ruminiclostridium papyrosolvens TaxID=29362 RepID=UPI0023E425CA|nr:tryptophan synthase subunit alpha [Ruminiclostridium papyrosolvens]WES35966.1 tryptophan synthase subunit alpha [Ruminiclostridium papyrosolvens DSM 2782]